MQNTVIKGTNMLTAEKREELIRKNREHAEKIGHPKFWTERCPFCKIDIVEHFGEAYATKTMTACPVCHESFCD